MARPSIPMMPAEWEPHAGTLLAWPRSPLDWPGKLTPVRWAYVEMIRALARHETVHLIVHDKRYEAQARQYLRLADVPMERVVLHRFPTDRAWMRDSGPVTVREGKKPVSLSFRFTAWAKYPKYDLDDKIPERLSTRINRECRPVPAVLEGGAIDVNGAGDLLTTEECLLSRKVQVRNPGMERGDYEELFRAELGVRNVIWLGDGIAGDDTHGHVDDLCRFVGKGRVVAASESNGSDVNHRPLAENLERLAAARLADGSRPEVVKLPMPSKLTYRGYRLPASYANFYIGNGTVLVPTFNDPHDRVALGILADCFPDRTVAGIHAVDLVWGFGTLHCLTCQLPA